MSLKNEQFHQGASISLSFITKLVDAGLKTTNYK